MNTNLETWTLVICIIRFMAPASALKWNNEEQFVDGELPYYPFNNKIINSLGDGLSGDDALANEFNPGKTDNKRDVGYRGGSSFPISGKRSFPDRSQKATFYEFKNNSNTVIDATKHEENDKSSKPVESVKSLGKIGRLVLKKTIGESKKTKAHREAARRSDLKKREDDPKKELRYGFEEQKTSLLRNELNRQPIFANGLIHNLSGVVTPESKSNAIRSYDGLENLAANRSEGNHNPRPNLAPKINGPYENNFSGGGFRHMNPSTWLAREIEKFIRRQDYRLVADGKKYPQSRMSPGEEYRWLDFMKNNGLETNGGMVESKHDASKIPQRPRMMDCLRQDEEGVAAEPINEDSSRPQDSLLHQIDALLEDLSQFRASVKHKKARDVRLTSGEGKHRQTRSVNLPNFRGKSELSKPVRSSLSSSLVLDDLRDLKRNIVLYENNVGEEENRQALKDLKLHIKVYVENDGNEPIEEK